MLQAQLPKIPGKSPLAKAIRYALNRLPKTRPYLDNGFLELDNNTCERAMKPVALGMKNWMLSGSECGGKAMAIAFTLIETAKLNGVYPKDWLADVLSRTADHKINRIDERMREGVGYRRKGLSNMVKTLGVGLTSEDPL